MIMTTMIIVTAEDNKKQNNLDLSSPQHGLTIAHVRVALTIVSIILQGICLDYILFGVPYKKRLYPVCVCERLPSLG